METVALIAGLVSIALAFFAIWQANHHRDQSDKLNRDTTEKLARIEAFATSTKEDAFAEIRRWGDFARAGSKASEEAEKAKEEEIKKLKDEIQASTSAEINKVLQTVESKLSSSTATSTLSEIKKEFDELKKEVTRIQEKGLGEVKRIESEKKLLPHWLSLSMEQRELLKKAARDEFIPQREFEKIGITKDSQLDKFVWPLVEHGIVWQFYLSGTDLYTVRVTPAFREFLKSIENYEVV